MQKGARTSQFMLDAQTHTTTRIRAPSSGSATARQVQRSPTDPAGGGRALLCQTQKMRRGLFVEDQERARRSPVRTEGLTGI